MSENLTNQQKSRFRRSDRETFLAENHGEAIKAMYARYSELYGVSVDALRALVAAEWKRDPKQYHLLQSQLAARRATAQGQRKQFRRTAPTSDRTPPKPEVAKQKQKKTKKGKKDNKGRPQVSRRKLTCPVCRKSVSVADNGCLKGHQGIGVWCRGSGRKITAPVKTPDKGSFGSGKSVRTVSGGVPGLGRRH